ncbi:MAG: hypothetical protein NT141_00855 [candidate division WWE3 bacterium]|nr:hypothetical protein [candidate division WWE3 bacterium]
MTKTITATQLKRNPAQLEVDVTYGGNTVIVEKHGKPMYKISPLSEPDDMEKVLDKYFGIAPDFPKVKRYKEHRPAVNFD